ncbi:MAG: phage tail protein [Clostridiales bacterium GWF2_38_85]|nr:MAG: phage tail protein [Clostridiales bacterium GWF2_38_85]HBL84686.1 phage tail protein [Clostridiales bacterium]
MPDSFGLKIGVEGEKEFRNALRDINQSFKVLGSEMNLVSSQFDKQDNSIQAITARNQVLNKELDTQKEKIFALEKALSNATTSFGENDKRTQAWAIQLNNAKAELNGLEREVEQNNKALDTAGNEFNSAEKQADQFGDEVKKTADQADDAGNRFDKLGSVLKGVGATLGIAVAAIGTAAISAAKSLTDMTVSASAYADEILTQATVTGMSTESLQAYKYAAELVDVSMETLTGSMAKQIKSMSSARDGSAKFTEAYDALGISVADSNGNLRDSETVYWETIDALGNIANETERDALAMQIFGKSAQELNPLIAQGSEGMAALTEEAKNMGAVMSDDSLNALGDFDDTVQRLKSGAGAAKNMLGTVLLPELQSLGIDGVSLLGNFTKGLSEANGDWGKITEVISSTVGSIVNIIMENLPKMIELGMDIISSIGGAILDNLPLIIDSAISIIMTLLQGLIKALPQLTEGALQLILALVQGIIDNLPALIEAAIQMVVTLALGIADALPELIPSIINAIILIVETLLANMDKILDAAFQLIQGLATGLLNALPQLIEKLPEIIIGIVDFITNNLPMIIEMGIQLTIQLAMGLIQAIPQLVAKLPEIIIAIIGGLSKAVLSVGEIGVNIVKGLWEGIKGMGAWLWEQVSGFFSGIVDGVKNFLGINSPSKVFAGIGDNMGKGIGVGFSDAMNGIEKDMQNSIPTDFDINGNITGSVSGGSKSGGYTVNHTGTIRVEGINDSGMLAHVVDIVIGELRQEVRV